MLGSTIMLTLASAAWAAPTLGNRTHSKKRWEWGPADLQEVCRSTGAELCQRFGTISTPVDHQDPDGPAGQWELKYFVNSDYWDPLNKPHGPIFINMWYGGTTAPGYTNSLLGAVTPSDGRLRQYPGASEELAEEMGALIISVPNRYYGCETARVGLPEGSCPTSLEPIPAGEDGTLEAHERLRYLSLRSGG
jgi:hypothetical protein